MRKFLKLTPVILLAALSCSKEKVDTPQQNKLKAAGVVFYQDYNYGGAASQTLAAGNYTMSQLASLGVPNDWASSVQIPSGWTVTMYQNDSYSGTSWVLTSNTSSFGSLSPSANDQMSSCKITSGGNVGSSVTINLGSQQQYIDGFGAGTECSAISDAVANASFSNGTNQMGLSICRVHFDPDGNDADEQTNASKAKSRGATILSSVWSPPASMKSNGSTIGGSLNSSSYAAYASWLNSERNKFGNIDIVSIQNEPNVSVSYVSCSWTSSQLQTFCQNNAQNIGGSVMMPEAFNFDVNYSDPTLNNATSASHISFIGGHLYGASPFYYTNAINKGKRVWMTEHYYNPDDIGTCMTMAKEINDCMTKNMSAYVWWYLITPDCNLLNSDGSLKMKGKIMAMYAKWVRPGYYRVDATLNPVGNVYVSAYKGTKNVIVGINTGTSSQNITFTFQNGTVTSVTPHITSSSKSISTESSVSLSNNSFSYTLPAQSVTTFVQN